ncbi:DNA polymerase III subunit delta' [Rhizosaccharibacter radicis]|uniref:DNA polymerase III subunit delta n=1 Tax=Rhizosaccharibacter radicis TaxID=2782605 RepID=A0ABT1VYQ6_9PROT|nr:DNA polymerase III subunit delta' [Acetobacteraceae bacterium KSS12]
MTVAAPREQARLFGHEQAEGTLLAAHRGGRLHHAWLLAGPEGVGKETLAFRAARWLLAGGEGATMAVAPNLPLFRRVAMGSHPDLLTVARAFDEKRGVRRDEIVIEDVRRVAEFLRRTAAEGGWRVVVVDGADRLNRNAANALLKLLEEPPARTLLLLTASAPGRLLPTIRSRCRTLRLPPLDRDAMTAALRHLRPDLSGNGIDELLPLSGGSPGRALALADDAAAQLRAGIETVLAGAGEAEQFKLAELALRRPDGIATFFDQAAAVLGDGIRRAARSGASLPQGRGLADGSELWSRLAAMRDDAERFTLDKRQTILSGLHLLGGS